jgi:hypothetical protein
MASAEYHRQWREKNREKLRAYGREYYAKKRRSCALAGRTLATLKDRRCCKRAASQRTATKKGLQQPTRPAPTVCECCGKKPKKGFCLDHDHLTDEFRGWLCGACNRSIGQLGDTLAGVINAVLYLQRYLQSRTK